MSEIEEGTSSHSKVQKIDDELFWRFDSCQRALSVADKSATHRRHIEGILKRGIERAAPAAPPVPRAVAKHEHVRGSSYYDTENDYDTQ